MSKGPNREMLEKMAAAEDTASCSVGGMAVDMGLLDKPSPVGLFADDPEAVDPEPRRVGAMRGQRTTGDIVKRAVFEREVRAFGSLKPDVMMSQWIAAQEHEAFVCGDIVGEAYVGALVKIRQLHNDNEILRGHLRTLLELQGDDEELIAILQRQVGSLQELYLQDGFKLTKLQDRVDGLEDQKRIAIKDLETIITWRQLGDFDAKAVEALCREIVEDLKAEPTTTSGN